MQDAAESMKRRILLAASAALYLLAAWIVMPGFYDGFAPPQPYRWVSPPPQAAATNIAPSAGHFEVRVTNGVSDAGSGLTKDGQVMIGFPQGAFDAPGRSSISVDIEPEATFPEPTGLQFATNVYSISASAPMIKDATLLLRYSDLVAVPPRAVYFAPSSGGAWRSIGTRQQSQPFAINTTTLELGYFAAGYPSRSASPPGLGIARAGQLLPIATLALIACVLIAALPLMIRRRLRPRDSGQEGAEFDQDDEF